jgi:hypothetical protein
VIIAGARTSLKLWPAPAQDGVVDTYDEDTINAAKAAVGLLNGQVNAMYGNQFIRIVPGSVSEQVVAGTRYTMDIEAGATTCRNTGTTLDEHTCPVSAGAAVQRYHIEIVWVPWQTPSYNLLSFHPVLAPTTPAPPPPAVSGPRLGPGGSCGDGSAQMCMVMIHCPSGTVAATMNGCTACVEPDTCLAAGSH